MWREFHQCWGCSLVLSGSNSKPSHCCTFETLHAFVVHFWISGLSLSGCCIHRMSQPVQQNLRKKLSMQTEPCVHQLVKLLHVKWNIMLQRRTLTYSWSMSAWLWNKKTKTQKCFYWKSCKEQCEWFRSLSQLRWNRTTYKFFIGFARVLPPFSAISIDDATTINPEIGEILKHDPE